MAVVASYCEGEVHDARVRAADPKQELVQIGVNFLVIKVFVLTTSLAPER